MGQPVYKPSESNEVPKAQMARRRARGIGSNFAWPSHVIAPFRSHSPRPMPADAVPFPVDGPSPESVDIQNWTDHSDEWRRNIRQRAEVNHTVAPTVVDDPAIAGTDSQARLNELIEMARSMGSGGNPIHRRTGSPPVRGASAYRPTRAERLMEAARVAEDTSSPDGRLSPRARSNLRERVPNKESDKDSNESKYFVRLGYDPRVFLEDPSMRGQKLTPEAASWAKDYRKRINMVTDPQMSRRLEPEAASRLNYSEFDSILDTDSDDSLALPPETAPSNPLRETTEALERLARLDRVQRIHPRPSNAYFVPREALPHMLPLLRTDRSRMPTNLDELGVQSSRETRTTGTDAGDATASAGAPQHDA